MTRRQAFRRSRKLMCFIVRHFERRTVLRPGLAVIVDPRRANVGVAEPLLHLSDVGLVIERIGGGRRPQRVGADFEAELRSISANELLDHVGIERLVELRDFDLKVGPTTSRTFGVRIRDLVAGHTPLSTIAEAL